MAASGLWRWRRPESGLAFTGPSVVALKRKSSSSRSQGSSEGWLEALDVPDGLVEVSPTTPNIHSVRELAEIVERALDAVGAENEPLAVALPDLAITAKVFPGRSRTSDRQLRRELGPALPYAASEARCDFWRGRHDEVLAAAIREPVVHQYEQIVEAVGSRLAWVDGMSLASIPTRAGGSRGLTADVQLYRGHYALTVFRDGELLDTRTKLRTPGDVSLVCREVLRGPALYHGDAIDSVRVSGEDASAVGDELGRAEIVREVRVDHEGEESQLRAALETLLARGNP